MHTARPFSVHLHELHSTVHTSPTDLAPPSLSRHWVAVLMTSELQSTVPSSWQEQIPPSCSHDSPTARLTSSSSRHLTSGASVMITSELHSGSPSSQVHTWILSPVFSSHRAPSLHVLLSSHVVRSPHKRLVQPARSPARQRQLLQPSGLHESPSLLARPVTRSLPQPSPPCGRFCGRVKTREDTEQSTIALLIMIF